MVKVGIGLPGHSIAEARSVAEVAASYPYESFSVYGDLGDLPPYAVLHATADVLRDSRIGFIGPMGVPIGMQHTEVIGMHALALEEQLPTQSYVGLVRGAFLEAVGKKPANLMSLENTIVSLRNKFQETDRKIPVYVGGFGQRVLSLAGRLAVDGVKLGGSTNPTLAKQARQTIGNSDVEVVLGAVSVIDPNRKAARAVARREVGKYLHTIGHLDVTLDGDEKASLALFTKRFEGQDPDAGDIISDALLDKFALAGTPEDAISALQKMKGVVDRFEFGTPHGLHGRAEAIRYIGDAIVNELGE